MSLPITEADRRVKLVSPQTAIPVDKTVVGDFREFLKAARFLLGSLDEAGLKPNGITNLRKQVEAFNVDGPRY